ncbi:hypothetical protein ACP70R_011045 [Stipagrostis hirtigluma subsp. patula]
MKTFGQMVPILAVIVALAVACSGVAAPPPPSKPGQQKHMFQVTVSVPDRLGGLDEDYNARLLSKVLGGSIEAAERAMYFNEYGSFGAVLTNNQARRLAKVPGVQEVEEDREAEVEEEERHL